MINVEDRLEVETNWNADTQRMDYPIINFIAALTGLESITLKGNPQSLMDLIVSHGLTRLIPFAIEMGAQLTATDPYGNTPLHQAALNGHTETTRALIAAGAQPDCKNTYGDTPLHTAASHGKVETALAIIQEGGNINATGCGGNTPLHMAIGFIETVEALIKQQADLEVINNDGHTPLLLALTRWAGAIHDDKERYIDSAVSLLRAGSNINSLNPLHHAIMVGCTRIAQELILRGADLETTTDFGDTPLHLAVYKGDIETVRLLLSYGANSEARNVDGLTPLKLAEIYNHPKMVEILTGQDE